MKEKITAIIPAAGRGRRMGADTNKLLLEVSGETVLSLTLDAFESCPLVDEVLIVANEQDIRHAAENAAFEKEAKRAVS